ncbi:MAG TPA: TolC family protein [Methylophilaceae bacterium]|nr:TolC family protein [Methylophilaceae bacterium]
MPAYSQGTVEAADGLTLANAIGLVLQANPEISVAKREREAIEGAQVQAAVRPNPSVLTTMEDTRNATRQTTLQLNQPIELGNKRAIRIEAAEIRYNAATADIDQIKAEIRASVISAFYDVMAAQERLELAKSTLELAQRASDAASKRVRAGKVSPVEETKAKVAEAGVRVELNQAASQLNTTRKKLAALWGNSTPRFERVLGQIDVLPVVDAIDDLTNRLQNAPALKRARLEIDRRDALAKVESSKRTPDLTVSVGARRNEELGLNQAVFGLSIPIPVFDRNQGNLQEALSRTDKARDEFVALEVQQTNALAEAYERFLAAKQESESLQTEILPGAQSAYDAAVKGFEFGKFGFLDVLDAQRTLFQARSQYLNALLKAHQAGADIERLVGDSPNSGNAAPALAQHQE